MVLNKPSTTKVNILGTEWTIFVEKDHPHFDEADGFCDESVKEIHIQIQQKGDYNISDISHYCKKVARREIIHAFLLESGLNECSLTFQGSWARNEEMVDWLAFQFHKIEKVFKELKI